MNIAGIDYGKRKAGISIGDTDSRLSHPLEVIRFEKESELVEKIKEIADRNNIGRFVLGISEGEMASETHKFAEKLKNEVGIPVVYQDETLSTKDAQELSLKSGMKRKKRKQMEDAFSASIILQNYLDNLVS